MGFGASKAQIRHACSADRPRANRNATLNAEVGDQRGCEQLDIVVDEARLEFLSCHIGPTALKVCRA